jgi:hypothetical protein
MLPNAAIGAFGLSDQRCKTVGFAGFQKVAIKLRRRYMIAQWSKEREETRRAVETSEQRAADETANRERVVAAPQEMKWQDLEIQKELLKKGGFADAQTKETQSGKGGSHQQDAATNEYERWRAVEKEAF